MDDCFVCKKSSTSEENPLKSTGCCFSRVHEECIDVKNAVWCPICKERFQVLDKVKRAEKFTPLQAEEIEKTFLNHYDLYKNPRPPTLTKLERKYVKKALKITDNPLLAASRTSNRIYSVCIYFLFDLPEKETSDWEDIASRLSLGYILPMLREMKSRYLLRQKNGGDHPVYHFLRELLEMDVNDSCKEKRQAIVRTCKRKCEQCIKFTKIIVQDDEYLKGFPKGAAFGNPSYLYDQVELKKDVSVQEIFKHVDFFNAVSNAIKNNEI